MAPQRHKTMFGNLSDRQVLRVPFREHFFLRRKTHTSPLQPSSRASRLPRLAPPRAKPLERSPTQTNPRSPQRALIAFARRRMSGTRAWHSAAAGDLTVTPVKSAPGSGVNTPAERARDDSETSAYVLRVFHSIKMEWS